MMRELCMHLHECRIDLTHALRESRDWVLYDIEDPCVQAVEEWPPASKGELVSQ